MRLVESKVYDNSIEYIDPASCGSSIGCRIRRSRSGYFDATVQLSDCDRKITWDFSGNDQRSIKSNVEKIDAAIEQLRVFRETLIRTHAEHTAWLESRTKKKARPRVGK